MPIELDKIKAVASSPEPPHFPMLGERTLIWFLLVVGSIGFGALSASEQSDLFSSLLEGSGSTAYERALPEEVYEAAREIYLVDLNGDNISEVMISYAGESVNDCVEVYEYGVQSRLLQKMAFQGGGICNYELRGSSLVSKYRDGAKWIEDVYFLHDKKFILLFTDSCVGCGWISRKDYQSGSEPGRYVVTDSPLFEDRMALLAKISTVRADVFLSPSTQSARVSTLKKGDELQVMQVEENEGEYYVRVKDDLRAIEGWVICEWIDKCDLL